ncbi:hypothetical protein PENSPDRAFT_652436 [Peniophora sp. CONT]|nr:hypothetical protein PENSPDRAFT_652436 [Peniophora sp. CONT]
MSVQLMPPSEHNSQRPTSKVNADAAPSEPKSRLFAVLIGVDKYRDSTRNLSGAVKDAQRMKAFLLKQQPPVSEDRIVFLKNGNATARAIIRCLQNLCGKAEDAPARDVHVQDGMGVEMRDKTMPSYGDPILIYYAGHGSTLPKPHGWTSENPRIQCLSPHDAGIGRTNSVINVIPDRTFGVLLERLANAKGNNITVILDCCHSGSGTRSDPVPNGVPRGMEFKDSNGKELTIAMKDVERPYQQGHLTDSQRGAVHLSQFANAGLMSHVVLAACGPHESAYEDPVKHEGHFTSDFLRVLQEPGTSKITYSELVQRLRLTHQTPRCEGRAKEKRMLFDVGLKERGHDCYTVETRTQFATRTQSDIRNLYNSSPYIIGAGEIHGIGKGDIFAIYRDDGAFTSGGDPLGELVVKAVTPGFSLVSHTVADPTLAITDAARAIAVLLRAVERPGNFRVSVDISKTHYPELRKRVDDALKQAIAASVDSPAADNADPSGSSAPAATVAPLSAAVVAITPYPGVKDAVLFAYQDENIHKKVGIKQLNGPVLAKASDSVPLVSAIRCAARFFRYLGPFSSPIRLRDQVDVRICELKGSRSRNKAGKLTILTQPRTGTFFDAKRCDLFKPTPSRLRDVPPTQTIYGVDVLNKSDIDMYAWLFYFDCSTLEIINYYSPPLAPGGGASPLPGNMQEALPLNYGDAGGDPLAFEVPKGQMFDGGFLRIFLSTRHIDLSNVAQDATVEPGAVKGVVKIRQGLSPEDDLWDAITIPVKLETRAAMK